MNRVLIVEDDTLLNTTLAYHLQGSGMGTESAFCCREAREKLEALRYDLVILDVNLPDGDGFTLCKQIQQEWKTAVIFLTANDLEKDVLKGYDLGAADYVTKPFSIQIFLKKTERLMQLISPEKKGQRTVMRMKRFGSAWRACPLPIAAGIFRLPRWNTGFWVFLSIIRESSLRDRSCWKDCGTIRGILWMSIH